MEKLVEWKLVWRVDRMKNSIKFSELQTGDVFTINREKNEIAYVKWENCIEQLNPQRKFAKLNGGTKVVKIGEMEL